MQEDATRIPSSPAWFRLRGREDVMRRHKWGLSFASMFLAMALASPASAETVQDARGDSGRSQVDLREVSVSQEDGTIAAEVVAYGRFGASAYPSLRMKGAPYVIDGVTHTEYVVLNLGMGDGWVVYRGYVDPDVGFVATGDVDVTRSDRRSVTFTFGAEALGSPEHFRWQVWVWELPQLEDVCDKAPNRGWVRE
jgi:hypothetical protein